MPKKTRQKDLLPKRQPTQRQLDKWERQRKWQRITIIASAALIGALLIFVGFGFYNEQVAPRQEPAVSVDNKVFDMGYFANVLATYTKGQDPDTFMMYTSIVAREIQQGEIIRRGAASLGIEVDEKNVVSTLEAFGLPNNRENRDLMTTQQLIAKLRTDYFGLQVPSTADQVNSQVMYTESRQAAEETLAKLNQGGDFSALAKELSHNMTTKDKGGELGWLPRELIIDTLGSNVVADAAFKMEKGALSQPLQDNLPKNVGYWILQVYERDPDSQAVKVKVMLLGSRQEAQDIRTRLLAGEDFSKLAAEYSQDQESKDKKGDLGVLPARIVGPLREASINIPVNVISEPIRDDSVETKGGYWLVKLIDKETNRKLDDSARNQLIDKAFNKWVDDLSAKAKMENYLTAEKISWAISRLPKPKTK